MCSFYEAETLAFMPVLTVGRWNKGRLFKRVQSPFTFALLEQFFCVSLVANKLSLCFCVWFYGFYCWNDESTGKPCNDRGKHSLEERKNTLKLWRSQAPSVPPQRVFVLSAESPGQTGSCPSATQQVPAPPVS